MSVQGWLTNVLVGLRLRWSQDGGFAVLKQEWSQGRRTVGHPSGGDGCLPASPTRVADPEEVPSECGQLVSREGSAQ